MIIISIKQHLTNISSSIHEKVRNSRPEVFYKKGVLRNFTKFTGKHLCQSLFFNKVAVLRLAALLKRDSGAGVFGATCSIFHPSKKKCCKYFAGNFIRGAISENCCRNLTTGKKMTLIWAQAIASISLLLDEDDCKDFRPSRRERSVWVKSWLEKRKVHIITFFKNCF